MFDWTPTQSYGVALSYATVLVFIVLLILVVTGKFKVSRFNRSFRLLAFFVCFAFIIRLPFVFYNEVSYDEHYYISASIHYMNGEFYYNYEHPPLIKCLLGVYLKTVYPNGYCEYWKVEIEDRTLLLLSRFFVLLFGIFTIVPVYYLGEKIWRGMGVFASLFLALNPCHARMSGLTYLDVPMIFFGMAAILSMFYFLDKPNWKSAVLCGIVNGLLLATKWIQPIIFIIPAFIFSIVYLVYYRKVRVAMFFPVIAITSLTLLFALWIPVLSVFDFKVYEYYKALNNHWMPQLTLPERGFIEQVLWNTTFYEFMLYIFCLATVTALLVFLSWKRNFKNLMLWFPVLAVTCILAFLIVEARKAVHYYTPITPFWSIIIAESIILLSSVLINGECQRTC